MPSLLYGVLTKEVFMEQLFQEFSQVAIDVVSHCRKAVHFFFVVSNSNVVLVVYCDDILFTRSKSEGNIKVEKYSRKICA